MGPKPPALPEGGLSQAGELGFGGPVWDCRNAGSSSVFIRFLLPFCTPATLKIYFTPFFFFFFPFSAAGNLT